MDPAGCKAARPRPSGWKWTPAPEEVTAVPGRLLPRGFLCTMRKETVGFPRPFAYSFNTGELRSLGLWSLEREPEAGGVSTEQRVPISELWLPFSYSPQSCALQFAPNLESECVVLEVCAEPGVQSPCTASGWRMEGRNSLANETQFI